MILALTILLFSAPVAFYLWREHKTATPKLHWPWLARVIGLSFETPPPRMKGLHAGRQVRFEERPQGGVLLTAKLAVPTRLRVECGPKELVARRAGVLVPDAVESLHAAFAETLLARCSEKAAGPVVFDAATQERLAALPVDLVAQGETVSWTVPAVKDPDHAEALLGAICAVADSLESFPVPGGQPRA